MSRSKNMKQSGTAEESRSLSSLQQGCCGGGGFFCWKGLMCMEFGMKKFNEMTLTINDLQEEFEENDSEIETAARDSIAIDVIEILKWFEIDLDAESAIGARDW